MCLKLSNFLLVNVSIHKPIPHRSLNHTSNCMMLNRLILKKKVDVFEHKDG